VLYDLNGKEILRGMTKDRKGYIDGNNLVSGNYFLVLMGESSIEWQKVVIDR
jgi:hypothetical protein